MQSTLGGTDSAEQFLPARQVWERYGVTSMTLWRWLKDADLKFPQPMRIGRLRYWRLSSLIAWERARCSKSVEMKVVPLPDAGANLPPIESPQLTRTDTSA
jgi:predicted DNA-binding transcriptional regulator AlpA